MPQFDNPFEIKPSGARPIPGVISQKMATQAESMLKLFGVTLYVHEHEGLANFIGALLRAWPKLGDYWKPVDPPS